MVRMMLGRVADAVAARADPPETNPRVPARVALRKARRSRLSEEVVEESTMFFLFMPDSLESFFATVLARVRA